MTSTMKPTIFSVITTTLIACMAAATLALTALVLTNMGQVGSIIKFVQHNEKSIDPAWTQNLNSQIDKELSGLVQAVGADRSTVGRFHNGKVDLQGLHFVYLSRTNEVDSPGVGNEINQFQNLPTSMYNQQIHAYIVGECFIRQTIERAGDSINQYYRSVGIKSTVRCPIFDQKNNLVAQAGVDFINEQLDPSRSDQIVAAVKLTSSHVQELLNNAR